MKIIPTYLLPAVGLILALNAPALGQGDPKTDPKAEKRVVAAIDQDGVQRVAVLGGGYFYDPNYIVVKVNVPVELAVRRESGLTPHDFVINAPEAGINVSVSMDTKPQLVKFTATRPGTYPFICTKKMIFMKSHKDKGMVGVLEVTE